MEKEQKKSKKVELSQKMGQLNIEEIEICSICGAEKKKHGFCDICNDWKMD